MILTTSTIEKGEYLIYILSKMKYELCIQEPRITCNCFVVSETLYIYDQVKV